MLKRLHLRNFTVFEDAEFEFGEGLNVLVGTNGTGKSHVLKVGYAVQFVYASVSRVAPSNRSPWNGPPQVMSPPQNAQVLSPPIGLSLVKRLSEVFLPNNRGALVRQPAAAWLESKPAPSISETAEVETLLGPGGAGIIQFSLSSDGSLSIPAQYVAAEGIENPVFIPPKEMLSLMPSIIGLSDKYAALLDATYTDLARLLVTPLLKQIPSYAQAAFAALGRAMNGHITADNGHFYLSTGDRDFAINVVAEGYKKIGTLTYLLANGTLTPETTLFWDEPEANLNPALLKEMAAVLAELARAGFQIILATHSLFLMKELHILSQREKTAVKYFGLFAGPGGDTQVETKDDFVQLAHVAALDAELAQTYDFEDALDQDYAGDN